MNIHNLNLHIGSRISYNNELATVKYIGTLEGTEGQWLGVEWDSEDRGKHNGEYKGKQIFNVRYLKSGSFIRPHPKLHHGRTLVEALRSKYVDNLDHAEGDVVHLKWGDNASKEIIAVGWDKLRRKQAVLEKLSNVGLVNEHISSSGPEGEIKNVCPGKDLNLSQNLICGWDILLVICDQLKHLEILRLNNNRFHIFIDKSDKALAAFSSIKTLTLNHCALTWQEIEKITSNFDNLEFLIAGNNLTSHDIKTPSTFQNLKLLNLEANEISSWDMVQTLSNLPHLMGLYLKSNKLSSIYYAGGFKFLENMDLSNNMIDNWHSIDELNKFPALRILRILHNPFQKDLVDESNLLIVARISKIDTLNSQLISPRERNDAEFYYLSSIMKMTSSPQEARILHPRFDELYKKHGEPEFISTKGKDSREVLKNTLHNIYLTHKKDISDEISIKSIQKKLPQTITLRNLKAIVQRLFRIPLFEQRLVLQYKGSNENHLNIDLDNDFRDLSYYNIQDGDEIIILSK